MKHIELHVIETDIDAERAELVGLITDAQLITSCLGCEDEVGDLEEFEPYVVVIDEDTQWVLCLHCAEPVFDPVTFIIPTTNKEVNVDEDGFFEIDD